MLRVQHLYTNDGLVMRIILTSLQCAPEMKGKIFSQSFTLIVQLLKFINHQSTANDFEIMVNLLVKVEKR